MTETSAPVESLASSILLPYVGGADSRARRRWRLLIWPAVIVFCLLYGLAFGLLGPFLPLAFAIPPAVLGVLAIWALPEFRRAPTASLTVLLYAFLVALVMWPNYLALALPGLPWITMVRLTGFPLALVLLVCVSISGDFRARLGQTLSATPYIWKLFAVFLVIQTLSIGLSHNPFFSIDKYIVAQISWTAVFIASTYIFLKPGRVERMAALLWLMAIGVGMIGILEWRHSHVPWFGHIPGFLKIEDESVQRILAGQTRSANGIYRIQSTFSTSLGLAEYLALAIPFVVHFAFGAYRWFVKLAAAASIPFLLFIVIVTGSRLGMVGCMITLLSYTLIWAILRWRRRKESLFGPAVTLAYPVIFCAAIGATFLVARLRALVWGNGPQQFSDEGRKIQLHMALPKIFGHPWGHGIAMGGDTLGYYTPAGILTIDSYYLTIALEYGVIGFMFYFGMLLASIYYSGKYVLTGLPEGRDFAFLTPLAIALTNFFVVKSVFSQQDNHPLVFMMLGMIVALVWRVQQQRADAKASALDVTRQSKTASLV